MMKLLLAVIATCALVVSPTCIKIKHQLRSNAPTIDVVISNGNTQMTSQVARDGSHRFTTDNLSNMTLAPAGTQTITLSYDQIFPLTDAAVCTEVHPLSAGGCADGVCCKISISMYTITDAIIMTARVNNRKADGNPQFWKCEQEIQVPGVTNTELSPEELVTDILHGEAPGDPCTRDAHCGDFMECISDECECVPGYIEDDDGDECISLHGYDCTTNGHADCGIYGCDGGHCVACTDESCSTGVDADGALIPGDNCDDDTGHCDCGHPYWSSYFEWFDGSSANGGKNKCAEKRWGGDDCTADVQCKSDDCTSKGKCTCDDNDDCPEDIDCDTGDNICNYPIEE